MSLSAFVPTLTAIPVADPSRHLPPSTGTHVQVRGVRPAIASPEAGLPPSAAPSVLPPSVEPAGASVFELPHPAAASARPTAKRTSAFMWRPRLSKLPCAPAPPVDHAGLGRARGKYLMTAASPETHLRLDPRVGTSPMAPVTSEGAATTNRVRASEI